MNIRVEHKKMTKYDLNWKKKLIALIKFGFKKYKF